MFRCLPARSSVSPYVALLDFVFVCRTSADLNAYTIPYTCITMARALNGRFRTILRLLKRTGLRQQRGLVSLTAVPSWPRDGRAVVRQWTRCGWHGSDVSKTCSFDRPRMDVVVSSAAFYRYSYVLYHVQAMCMSGASMILYLRTCVEEVERIRPTASTRHACFFTPEVFTVTA